MLKGNTIVRKIGSSPDDVSNTQRRLKTFKREYNQLFNGLS